ncbi:MAG: EamA family transporter [Chloroflexi bacterium]|nr:MAG: EamA family transporter [Chloroflexota bacterium]
MPLFAVVIAHLWLQDERITLSKVIGLLVGFLGVVGVIRSGTGELSLATLRGGELGGQLAVVLASASYATATVFARRYLQSVHAFVLAAGQLTAGVLFMSFAMFAWEWPVVLHASTPAPFLAVITLGLVNTGLAYMLFFFLVSEVGATRTTLVTYVIPAVGLFLGFVFLDEPLNFGVVFGFLLILAGVLLVNQQAQRKSPESLVPLPPLRSESVSD